MAPLNYCIETLISRVNKFIGHKEYYQTFCFYIHDLDSPAANVRSQNKIFGFVDSKQRPRSPTHKN